MTEAHLQISSSITKRRIVQNERTYNVMTEFDVKAPTDEATKSSVKASFGMTLGLPGYSSVRVDVSGEMPCHVDAMDDAFNAMRDWAQGKVKGEIEAICEDTGVESPL